MLLKKRVLKIALLSFVSLQVFPVHLVGGSTTTLMKKEENNYLWWGLGAAVITLVGGALYLNHQEQKKLEQEPADNIPNYLRTIDDILVTVEGHEYIRAWLAGGEWQQWLYNKAHNCEQAADALRMMNALGELRGKLIHYTLKEAMHKAEFLTKKHHVYGERLSLLKQRISKVEHALREIDEVVQKAYKKLDAKEVVQRKYNALKDRINTLQLDELFAIDINTVKAYALQKYGYTSWPFSELSNHLERVKKEADDLLYDLRNAGAHDDQMYCIRIVEELQARIAWAIDFITKDADYAIEYGRRQQYERDHFGR